MVKMAFDCLKHPAPGKSTENLEARAGRIVTSSAMPQWSAKADGRNNNVIFPKRFDEPDQASDKANNVLAGMVSSNYNPTLGKAEITASQRGNRFNIKPYRKNRFQ